MEFVEMYDSVPERSRKKLVSLGDDEVLYEMLVIGTSLDDNVVTDAIIKGPDNYVIQTDLSLYRKFVCVRSVGFWKF